MTLPEELLEQARHLLARDEGRPKQANLRRAISAAYYALFHQLIDDTTFSHVSSRPTSLRQACGRSISHQGMKKACQSILNSEKSKRKPSIDLLARPLDGDLIFVMNAFVELQDARHDADYNTIFPITRSNATKSVTIAEEAYFKWRGPVAGSDNGKVLMAAFIYKLEL